MLIEYKHLLEDVDERSAEYDDYLIKHIANVRRGYEWIKEHLPHILDEHNFVDESAYYGNLEEIIDQHDQSKYRRIPETSNYYELRLEYDAYAEYFYGEKTSETKRAFDFAWLAHIHSNPHHWQHWVLVNDDGVNRALDMPYVFIIEMICDQWSFSWKAENLYEIFTWYEAHKDIMLLSEKTRRTYEKILSEIREVLDTEG